MNGSYYSSNSTNAALVSNHNAIGLWHLRLGHMSKKGMNIPSRQGVLGKAPIQSLEFYLTYVPGKQRRLSFPKGTHLAKACLEYVHADLW